MDLAVGYSVGIGYLHRLDTAKRFAQHSDCGQQTVLLFGVLLPRTPRVADCICLPFQADHLDVVINTASCIRWVFCVDTEPGTVRSASVW